MIFGQFCKYKKCKLAKINFTKLIYLTSRIFLAWTFLNFLAQCGPDYMYKPASPIIFKLHIYFNLILQILFFLISGGSWYLILDPSKSCCHLGQSDLLLCFTIFLQLCYFWQIRRIFVNGKSYNENNKFLRLHSTLEMEKNSAISNMCVQIIRAYEGRGGQSPLSPMLPLPPLRAIFFFCKASKAKNQHFWRKIY